MIKIDTKGIRLDKIEQTYENYIIPQLRSRIENEINKERNPSTTNAQRIAILFLKKHFLDEHRLLSDDKIAAYLYCNHQNKPNEYLESIIISYWESLAEVLSSAAGIPKPNDAFILALSKWELIKTEALSKSDGQRFQLIASIIRDDTLYLFSNVSKIELFNWSMGRKLSDTKLKSIDIVHHKDAIAILEGIFNYSELLNNSSINPTPRHQIMSAMGVSVCPYCNRQYITIYNDSESDTEKSTADLDHYYIKSAYPYLSLSLYNFVPSCQICNSRFKKTKDFYIHPHIYPYTQEFGDSTHFVINLSPDLMKVKDRWDDPLILSLDSTSEPPERKCAIDNAINTFHLNDVYRSHLDYAQEMFLKSQAYNETSISLLQPIFDQFGSNFLLSDVFFGQYIQKESLHKRPLAKLARDILAECSDDVIK